jgi:PKD repeat protein
MVVSSSGSYSIYAIDTSGCVKLDTINVIINGVAPVANFEKDSVCVSKIVQFEDNSYTSPNEQILFWKWDFGDGVSSSEKSPSHIYEKDTVYKVRLDVYSNTGCSSYIEKDVVVVPKPYS